MYFQLNLVLQGLWCHIVIGADQNALLQPLFGVSQTTYLKAFMGAAVINKLHTTEKQT